MMQAIGTDLVARVERLECLVAQLAVGATTTVGPKILSRREAAVYARVGLSLVDEAIRCNDLRTIKKGRRVLITRAALDAWLADGEN
jgi:excisionase family DNA binding protein